MENVLLIVHLIIALFLIAVVLLQRSEGGALGIGGGGGGMVSARGAATALSKITWALAVGFICTSIMLTIVAGGGRDTGSVFDGSAAGEEGGAIKKIEVQLLITDSPARQVRLAIIRFLFKFLRVSYIFKSD